MTDHYNEAFKKLMDLEGWDKITNDPDDPGGTTKYGISKKSYPHLNIGALGLEQAKAIYYQDYWQTVGIHRILDKGLAIKVFCTGVVMGPFPAIRFLQMACNVLGADLKVDGVLGPVTSAWINGYRHADAIEAAFECFASEYIFKIGSPKYIAGWLIRIDRDMT